MSNISVARQPIGSVSRRPGSGSLAEVVDIILDKGLVLDAYVRVAVVGIQLLTIEARVVIASVDTFLHFAEATNRLDIAGQAEERDAGLMDLMSGMSEEKTEGAIEGASDKMSEGAEGAKERIKNVFGAGDDDGDDD